MDKLVERLFVIVFLLLLIGAVVYDKLDHAPNPHPREDIQIHMYGG